MTTKARVLFLSHGCGPLLLGDEGHKAMNEAFEDWLLAICASSDISEENTFGSLLSPQRRALIATAYLLWFGGYSLFRVF